MKSAGVRYLKKQQQMKEQKNHSMLCGPTEHVIRWFIRQIKQYIV